MSQEHKAKLRQQVLSRLRNQKEEDKRIKSNLICEKVIALPAFQNAKNILFYASFDGEVDTFELMKRAQMKGKVLLLPKLKSGQKIMIPTRIENLERDLEAGLYGIPQPKPSCPSVSVSQIDCVVVPGVAFDRAHRRLGRGGGYYDRFLSQLSADIPTVGLAYDIQVVDDLSPQDHDVPVMHLITN